jgi:hypothetical protein
LTGWSIADYDGGGSGQRRLAAIEMAEEGGGGSLLTAAAVRTAVGTAVAEAGGLRPGGGYNVRLQITADYDGDSCGDS